MFVFSKTQIELLTGLHFDIQRLLDALHRLVDAGNIVIVIEYQCH